MARETIKAVLRKYSLLTSFIPMSSPITTNGAHCHLSIWKDDKNISIDLNAETKMTETASYFIASLLEALPAMVSILCPTFNGLKRL